ncbi:DUF4229 domain-containing protein [Nocardioides sp. GCM10027113]|uniref:DUF4229 domain-containing protein n=1 Tax=unclassified Nocardioides TaxID=2615069 RepID=UPI0036077D5F
MKEFAVYTAMRIGLFLTSLVVVVGVWMLIAGEVPLLWAVVIAFAVSGVGSYFLLNRQREAFARRVDERARRMAQRYDEAKSKEDVD